MKLAINLDDKFSRFTDQWRPKIVARINDYEVKLVRLEGEFVWHEHPDTDELFLVLDGNLTIRFRDGDDVDLGAGEMYVVQRGIEHCPVTSGGEVRALLLEPAGVVNTGESDAGAMTAPVDESLLD